MISETPNRTVKEADEAAEVETEIDAPVYKKITIIPKSRDDGSHPIVNSTILVSKTSSSPQINENSRYQTNKVKDRRAVFLKVALKKKQFYKEFLLLNKFDPEFDQLKRDHIKLEKFIKISNKE